MNKPAQGAQWSPREQRDLEANYWIGDGSYYYEPLPDPEVEGESVQEMRCWEPWAALALVIAVIGVINFGYLVF